MVAKNQPIETREVVCTHCEHAIEIPATAMSVSCRLCHQRVIIEDLVIKAYHSVRRLATAGRVEVAKRARVLAEIRVDELVVNGDVTGNVTALNRIVLSRKGSIVGDVACRSLSVEAGATLVGHVEVDPGFAPQPAQNAEE